jgi:hypothetical protein
MLVISNSSMTSLTFFANLKSIGIDGDQAAIDGGNYSVVITVSLSHNSSVNEVSYTHNIRKCQTAGSLQNSEHSDQLQERHIHCW